VAFAHGDHIFAVAAEEAFIVQRRDGEVMISFFKAAVSDGQSADGDRLATSLAGGIASKVVHSAEESQRGHVEQAAQLLNETDEIANQVRPHLPCGPFPCEGSNF